MLLHRLIVSGCRGKQQLTLSQKVAQDAINQTFKDATRQLTGSNDGLINDHVGCLRAGFQTI
jgi:hypothetical protein